MNNRPVQASQRARLLPSSPLRALLHSSWPETHSPVAVDLAGGIPDPALFPVDALCRASEVCLTDGQLAALQYMPTEGEETLRSWVRGRLAQRGAFVEREQIIVTAGGQNGLALCAQVLAESGRSVWVEAPGYPGVFQAVALAEGESRALAVTPEGWRLPSDREVMAGDVFFVTPACQNPTGRCASREMRRELASFARRNGAWLVEDDAYGELGFEESDRLSPLLTWAPERTLLVGSLSKVLAPGLRLGYVVAPPALVSLLVKVMQAQQLQAASFSQWLVARALEELDFDAHLAHLRRHYQNRAALLVRALQEHGLECRLPRGGLFAWARTREPASLWSTRAREVGIAAVPEPAFHPAGTGVDAHVRLAFSRLSSVEPLAERLRALDGIQLIEASA